MTLTHSRHLAAQVNAGVVLFRHTGVPPTPLGMGRLGPELKLPAMSH